MWDRQGSVVYEVFDIVARFDPATGALSVEKRTPHANSPQELTFAFSQDTAGAYHNHIYGKPGQVLDRRNSLWVQAYVGPDGAWWIGELGDHKQKHHPPLPYMRGTGPEKMDGSSEVWRFRNDGECFQYVPSFPWTSYRLTHHLDDGEWGPWIGAEWTALLERTENAPDVAYNYVTAPVGIIQNGITRRLVNFWYGVEQLDGSGEWRGHEYYAVKWS